MSKFIDPLIHPYHLPNRSCIANNKVTLPQVLSLRNKSHNCHRYQRSVKVNINLGISTKYKSCCFAHGKWHCCTDHYVEKVACHSNLTSTGVPSKIWDQKLKSVAFLSPPIITAGCGQVWSNLTLTEALYSCSTDIFADLIHLLYETSYHSADDTLHSSTPLHHKWDQNREHPCWQGVSTVCCHLDSKHRSQRYWTWHYCVHKVPASSSCTVKLSSTMTELENLWSVYISKAYLRLMQAILVLWIYVQGPYVWVSMVECN